MLFDFVTGLMPVAPARKIDLTPIFEAIDLDLLEEVGGETEQNLQVPDPWVLPISNSKKPVWLSMGEIHTIESVLLLPLATLRPAQGDALPAGKSKVPELASMTHKVLTEMCGKYGIPHQKPGNKRKTKKELIADLTDVMVGAI